MFATARPAAGVGNFRFLPVSHGSGSLDFGSSSSARRLAMTSPDIFLLKKTGLDPFLLAEIGVQENGSPLTMLSVLARLGHDPWAEAARWARLPHAAATRNLADLIRQMPLRAQALDDAPRIAAQLSQLLPGRATAIPDQMSERTTAFLVMAGLCIGLSFALMFVASKMPNHGTLPEGTAASTR